VNWLSRHRAVAIALICALCATIIALGRIFPGVPFIFAPWDGEQQFHDLLRKQGRAAPARADFVYIGIDEQSRLLGSSVSEEEIAGSRALQLMAERAFPWSREVWALLLDQLFAAGARVVIFDLIFNPPNEGDPAFAAALERYRDRVVVGANFDRVQNNQHILPNSTLIPPPAALDDRVGFVNFWPDLTDGVLREVRFFVTERQLAGQAPIPGDVWFSSLGAAALTKFGHAVPRDLEARPFRFGPAGAYQPRNLYELFLPEMWRRNYGSGAFFKDKLVIIGASAQIMQDFVATPLSPNTPGPAVHLHAMAAALEGEFLAYTSVPVGYGLLAAGGAVAWLIVAFVRRPLVSLSLLIATGLAYLVAARLFYDLQGFFLLTVPVLSVFVAGGLLSLGFEYWLERLEKLRTRRTLERFVSKNLVKEVLENPASYYNSLRGVRIPVTVLFSDLIGFTTMTETADPEKLVKQLNEYLSRMTAAVFQEKGTVDKFIGDAVMAVWGNVSSRGVAEDAKAAARTALTMRRELVALNARWAAEGIDPFRFGLGINHGEAVAASIGSQEKADPTVIGDAVNLASRLEGLTRTYGVDILVGGSAAELMRDGFHLRSVARVQVKGKTKPVETFTLIGARGDDSLDAEWLRWLETYEEAIVKFRARDFSEAKILLSRFLEFYPDDQLAKNYLQRALEYEQQPPDESWSAAEVFTKK
jgi:adenylate cyclase